MTNRVIKASKNVYGKFSDVAGSRVRRVYDEKGNILGIITKTDRGTYRIVRMDGKVREKRYLDEAFKSISRAN